MKFKAGDKVIIISKTYGDYSVEEVYSRLRRNFGSVLTIYDIQLRSHKHSLQIIFEERKASFFFFMEDDLKLANEKEEYVAAKRREFCLAGIYNMQKNRTACFLSHYYHLLQTFGEYDISELIDVDTKLIEWAKQSQERIDWLIKYEYIKKVVEEKTYHIGQKFKCMDSYSDKRPTYILVSFPPNKVFLASLYSGMAWRMPVEVEDVDKITESEFRKITCGLTKFKLVK